DFLPPRAPPPRGGGGRGVPSSAARWEDVVPNRERPVVRFDLRNRAASPTICARFPLGRSYENGSGFRQRHRHQPAAPLAAESHGPGGLGELRAALRPADLLVVPTVATAGGGRGGRHPERPADPRGQAARVPVRPQGPLPRLAEDRRP